VLTRAVTKHAALWLAALLLPLASSVTAVLASADPATWWSMSAAARRGFAADALLYIAGAVVLCAPLAGVVVAARSRLEGDGAPSAFETTWTLTAAAAIFVASSATLMVLGWGLSDAEALRLITTSHATMFAVALGLAGFGAVCGATFGDSLDAAGCSLSVVLVAAGVLLVAGTALANVPRALLDVPLAVSPFIVMASAAHIDVLRTAVPYQMSPLAHLQVHYPAWYLASAWYLAFAGFCFVGVQVRARTWQLTSVRLKGRIA
jgi:hypothetical protein